MNPETTPSPDHSTHAEEVRRQIAEQLDLAPSRPGDDPPTNGDEGGGTVFADQKKVRGSP